MVAELSVGVGTGDDGATVGGGTGDFFPSGPGPGSSEGLALVLLRRLLHPNFLSSGIVGLGLLGAGMAGHGLVFGVLLTVGWVFQRSLLVQVFLAGLPWVGFKLEFAVGCC